jgi:gliding motility-associated-like protein
MSNGSASVTVTGGVGPYTYSWAPSGGTAASTTGRPAGTYTVTFTDANGCTGTATVNIPNAAAPTATITATTSVSCFGGNNGSATVAASGGTAPYTYAWSPIGGTGTTGTALTAQSYTVTVTDVNGCTATATTTITQPTAVTASASSSPVLCNGGSTGSATVTPGGGIGPYTYAWAPSGGTAASATGLSAQTYTVTVTDANGCTTTATTTVTQPTAVTATAASSPVLCNGGSTGSATVTPAGGTTPYTYAWAPSGGTSATATGLTAQTYTVTVTDANGCTITATTTVTQPTALAATTSFTQATCGASNGTAAVSVSGGIGPYTYSWAPSGGTAATATGLASNTYTVTYTDANGCTGTATANVPNAASPTITITGTTNVSCFGGSNGSATSSASGGTGPYTYAWAPIGGTGSTGTNLTAQNYTVTVTDANGCTATATTTITEPTLVTATSSTVAVLCNGGNTGSATAVGAGGIAPYTYSWNSAPVQNTATATGLTAASYTCTVTDANGCTTTTSVTVTEPTVLTATASMNPVLCNGGNTGDATVVAGGGIGPYTYSWSPSGGTGTTASNLTAQGYTVTVTDANGCTITASTTVTEPTALTATTSFTQSTCSQANGSADVTVSGGIGPYTYSWAPTGCTAALATGLTAQTYTVTYTDANGCTNTATVAVPNAASPSITVTGTTAVTCFGGADGTATSVTSGGTAPYTYAWAATGGTGAVGTGMIAGNYTVTVTDANGCTATATTTITEPTLVTATSSTVAVLCNGGNTGSATAVGAGGIAPYTYSWNSAPVQTTATATGLTAASYTCTVTDANGCTTTTSVTVTEPTQVTSTISGVDILCFGGNNGSATVVPAGGIGPYTYLWTPSGQTTVTATTLTAQTYSCDITDANGCSITMTITLTEPPALAAVTSFTQSTCSQSNGSADVTVSGGVGPYTYAWAPSGGTAALESNIPMGSYTVTFTDANGCVDTAQVNVPNAASPSIVVSGTTAVTCFGGADGTATSVTSGGTAPYTYAWAATGGTGAVGTGMIASNYTVTVTDANGCTATATTTITEPTLVTATSSTVAVLCFGGNTGSATAVGAGGISPYTYSWNSAPVQTTATATGLTATSYTCTVTDANGCTTTTSVTVTEPTQVTSTISGVDILCFGGNNGSATVVPAGGIGPYTYLWTPSGQTTVTATTLTAQNYSCDITDANGCSITMTITLTEPPALSAVTSFTQSTCGSSNGTADVVVSGGVGPYTYNWLPNGGTGSTATGIPAGPYTCDITDANGCTMTASVTVPSAPGPVAVIGTPTNVLCFGGNTGSATASVSSGGTGPFSYLWSNNDNDSLAGNLIAGSYSVTITDVNGCTSTATVLITEPSLLTIQANANPNTICAGQQVALSANAGGGVGGYGYSWTPGPLSGANQNVSPVVTTTYVVTVTDGNGCTASQNVPVTVNPLPVPVTGADVTQGCAPVCVNFSDLSTITSGSITSWAWDFGDGNTSTSQNPSLHCYDSAGVYDVTLVVVSSDGCTQTITMNNYIEVFANPVAAFGAGPQPTTILNPEICFTDSSILAAQWDWNFGDFLNSASTVQNPCFTYNEPDCYLVTLTVTSADGCTDVDTQTVCIGPDVSIYVPNTFTPNGNGLNDIFIPITVGIDPENYELWIFDRWGNLIWYTNDLDEGWDGRVQGHSEIVQQDTYVWKIVSRDMIGNQHNLIGHINVIK